MRNTIDHKTSGRTQRSAPTDPCLSLPDIIRQFKTWTTIQYANNVTRGLWPEFQKRLWQRNYYEHIIRTEHELRQTREYIRNNPANWHLDEENPVAIELASGRDK